MEKFLEVLLDSTIDTAKLVPILVLVYFLIEFLEYKNVFKFEKSKLLNGKASPAVGALFGSVPQCGFSVISAELYAKRKISIAALISVFIATSDEALPIMLSDYRSIPSLLFLILTKIIMAIAIGYLTMFFFKLFFKTSKPQTNVATKPQEKQNSHPETHDDHHESDKDEHSHIHACCHHDIENSKFNWKHPLIHSLKITIYIFLVNILIGGIVALIGEQNLINFLKTSYALQPIVALVVGLIPNCVSSVVLTELYLMGGLSFGAIVTGLSVNAGIGLLVLFKENKSLKENLFILAMLIIPSLIFGYALHFVPLDFLRI